MSQQSQTVLTEMLLHAPVELTRQRLRRLGEGVGKVVYGSQHWVVQRERSPFEVLALILLWRTIRKIEHLLPERWGREILNHPSKQLRFLRVVTQATLTIIPKGLWFTTHIRAVWSQYHRRSFRGERLAKAHLTGTELIPQRVVFPPARVAVAGWPGWLLVCAATERVEATLYARLAELAAAERFEEFERWLDRFLDFRQSGWKLGVFSVDAHLKNFGVCGERIVLLDTGGLTNRWAEIEKRLAFEDSVVQPHAQLGLSPFLATQPEIAQRFDRRWKATVNRDVVRRHWPESQLARQAGLGMSASSGGWH